MTEKSSLTASAVASKLDANVNFIQGPCRAAGINAFKAQCIPPAQLVVLICPQNAPMQGCPCGSHRQGCLSAAANHWQIGLIGLISLIDTTASQQRSVVQQVPNGIALRRPPPLITVSYRLQRAAPLVKRAGAAIKIDSNGDIALPAARPK